VYSVACLEVVFRGKGTRTDSMAVELMRLPFEMFTAKEARDTVQLQRKTPRLLWHIEDYSVV